MAIWTIRPRLRVRLMIMLVMGINASGLPCMANPERAAVMVATASAVWFHRVNRELGLEGASSHKRPSDLHHPRAAQKDHERPAALSGRSQNRRPYKPATTPALNRRSDSDAKRKVIRLHRSRSGNAALRTISPVVTLVTTFYSSSL